MVHGLVTLSVVETLLTVGLLGASLYVGSWDLFLLGSRLKRLNTVEVNAFLHVLSVKDHALLQVFLLTLNNLMRFRTAVKVVAHGVLHLVDEIAFVHKAVGHTGGHFSEAFTGNVVDLLFEHMLDLTRTGRDVLAEDSLDVVASDVPKRCKDPKSTFSFAKFLILDHFLDNIGFFHHLDVSSHTQDLESVRDELDNRN